MKREQQRRGDDGEDGVVERGLWAERERHREDERGGEGGAGEGGGAQAPADEQSDGEEDLGECGRDREELGDGGRSVRVELGGVGDEGLPGAPNDARGAGRSPQPEAIGHGREITKCHRPAGEERGGSGKARRGGHRWRRDRRPDEARRPE